MHGDVPFDPSPSVTAMTRQGVAGQLTRLTDIQWQRFDFPVETAKKGTFVVVVVVVCLFFPVKCRLWTHISACLACVYTEHSKTIAHVKKYNVKRHT